MRISDPLTQATVVPDHVLAAGLPLGDLGLYVHLRAALTGYSHPPHTEHLLEDLAARPGLGDVPAAELRAGIERLTAAGLLEARAA